MIQEAARAGESSVRIHTGWGKARQEIPASIGLLQNVEELEISGTGHTGLPPALRKLTRLRLLRIEFTSMTAVPDWIGELVNLTALRLNNNDELVTLPRFARPTLEAANTQPQGSEQLPRVAGLDETPAVPPID